MQRLAVAALLLCACGETDDRPQNLDYVTKAILAPSCGSAVCHSAFRQEDGLVFDTVDGARATFQADPQLIAFDDNDPNKTPGLVLNLTIEQPGAPRMPYDAPLPDVDIALIEDWLRAGAPGVCNGVRACLGQYSVPCDETHTITKDGQSVEVPYGAYMLSEFGKPANLCANGCRNGDCL